MSPGLAHNAIIALALLARIAPRQPGNVTGKIRLLTCRTAEYSMFQHQSIFMSRTFSDSLSIPMPVSFSTGTVFPKCYS